MKKIYAASALTVLSVVVGACTEAVWCASPRARVLEATSTVAEGLHPWYEVKADPESSKTFIVCGSKWDPDERSYLGVVYFSGDAGLTWETALEDRSSAWVTEQSCAFGTSHRAYFISEASKVIDGELHHNLGTTRLFVSEDGGRHWSETTKAGWADFSTSAVSSPSGRLYTFFNSTDWNGTPNAGVGLLVFSSDGKQLSGPFFDSALRSRGYSAVYPADALTLKNGSVAALYFGFYPGASERGANVDLGIVRASVAPQPILDATFISHLTFSGPFPLFNEVSLTYDHDHDRLYLLYPVSCDDVDLRLISSDDGGLTWTKPARLVGFSKSKQGIVAPSLHVVPNSGLNILWENVATKSWFLAAVLGDKALRATLELTPPMEGDRTPVPIQRPETKEGVSAVRSKLAKLTASIWRIRGLSGDSQRILAVWPSENGKGSQLNASVIARQHESP